VTEKQTGTRKKKKEKSISARGVVHIKNTFNNTIVTITDVKGDMIVWSTAGSLNFRGAKKSTPYAAQITTEEACKKAIDLGLKEVRVQINGPGFGRESAVRAVAKSGLKITQIKDVTGIPHNGCRPPKRRRV